MPTSVTGVRLQRAGLLLSSCSLAFVVVFAYLARAFDYPDVLARGADEVLPRLLSGGVALRAVWSLYAALPVGILIAGVASAPLLDAGGPRMRKVGSTASVIAALAMAAGLARWPTLEWSLARAWAGASEASRATLAVTFSWSNLLLGQVLGEFIGEVALAIWFYALALAFRGAGRRIVSALGMAAAALLAIAALRNVTPLVAPVAEVNNATLPLWLFTLGVLLFRAGAAPRRIV